MPLVHANGLTHHVQILGDGPGLVMLHGLLVGSLAGWYLTSAPRLARRHRVLLTDLRGHGKSDVVPSGYDVATLAGDLHALLERGLAGDGPFTLVGHSYGALVALRLALAEPEKVARLCLVEAPLPPSRVTELSAFVARPPEELAAALPAELRAALARGGRAARGLVERLARLASETTLLRDVAAERDVPDDVLATLRPPTLLVYGARSSCRPVGERLARVIPGARLELLPGGHFLPGELPGPLGELLDGFCDG